MKRKDKIKVIYPNGKIEHVDPIPDVGRANEQLHNIIKPRKMLDFVDIGGGLLMAMDDEFLLGGSEFNKTATDIFNEARRIICGNGYSNQNICGVVCIIKATTEDEC